MWTLETKSADKQNQIDEFTGHQNDYGKCPKTSNILFHTFFLPKFSFLWSYIFIVHSFFYEIVC